MLRQDYYFIVLRKQVIGRLWDHPHIFDHVKTAVDKDVYDKQF